MALLVVVLVVALASGGDVSEDPDQLSRRLAGALYDRDYDLLYEHATNSLKQEYGNTEGAWAAEAEERLEERGLKEGRVEIEDASVEHWDRGSLQLYEVFTENPDGRNVVVRVLLKPAEGETWAYCAIGAYRAGEGSSNAKGPPGSGEDLTVDDPSRC